MHRLLPLLLLLMMGPGAGAAAQADEGAPAGGRNARIGVRLEEVWARPAPNVRMAGAVYLTMTNSGGMADRLIGGRTEVADRVELHTHVMDGAVARMRVVAGGVDVPADGEAVLRPGGTHLMLTGLRRALRPGDHFDITLIFERAGARTVSVTVLAPGTEPGSAGGHHPAHNR